jgi:hypothetical protein
VVIKKRIGAASSVELCRGGSEEMVIQLRIESQAVKKTSTA